MHTSQGDVTCVKDISALKKGQCHVKYTFCLLYVSNTTTK